MEFDTIIRHGTVVDGTGSPARQTDVGIRGDRIEVVDELNGATASNIIDAAGRVVSPGFIDVHVHSEVALADPQDQRRYGSVLQGVTTHLTAPDGFGWSLLDYEKAASLWRSTLFSHGKANLSLGWPTAEDYLSIFVGNTPVNVVPQVPHCAVRFGAMGWDGRPATDLELEQMRATTREWMEAGAVALCLGLDYQPSAFADTRELIELSKVAAEYGGIYAAHVRYNDIGREAAWRETMEIGEQAGIPVHISHEHVTSETVPLLEEAARRCDLSFESYLYHASNTHLALTLPIWTQEGGPDGIRQRLRDPDARRRIQEHLRRRLNPEISGDRPVFVHTQTGRYIGQSIFDAARDAGMPVDQFAMKVLEEKHPYALMVYHRARSEEEVGQSIQQTIQNQAMIVASDGIYNGESAHPRGFGTFARVLRLCVREMGAVSLEDAIRKMSGYPAERFGIKDRGFLKKGYGADVVIIEPDIVADRATFEQPRLEPIGIDRVMVNGSTVVLAGSPTGELPGRVLRR